MEVLIDHPDPSRWHPTNALQGRIACAYEPAAVSICALLPEPAVTVMPLTCLKLHMHVCNCLNAPWLLRTGDQFTDDFKKVDSAVVCMQLCIPFLFLLSFFTMRQQSVHLSQLNARSIGCMQCSLSGTLG
jgi:hypothetical protein